MNTDKMEKIEQTGMICFWLAFVTELVIVMVDKSAYINPIEGQLFRITFLLCCIKIAVMSGFVFCCLGQWRLCRILSMSAMRRCG